MRKIQMVDLYIQHLSIMDELNMAIQKVIDSSGFINGDEVKQFSKSFAAYNNVGNVVPCANGTDALQIALMALDLKRDDEIIIPAHTYVATAEAVALLGLKPIFVDVEPDTFNINVDEVANKISSKTKAVVPVHLYGQCADMESLLQLAENYEIAIIEDTAQAIGAKFTFTNGAIKYAGTIGDIGTTSFFPSKNLGCFGDGGALLINSKLLSEKAFMIANHGQSVKYHHEAIGCNSRLDSVQAAVLNVKLKYLNESIEKRKRAAAAYNEGLKNINALETPVCAQYSSHTYHQYTLKINNGKRDYLKQELLNKNIPSMIYYPIPLHLQKGYVQFGYKKGDFPVAEELSETVLSIPIHPEITLDQQEYIMNSIKEIVESN